MKMGPDALVTAENESGHAKHLNGTRRPRYHRKRGRVRKTLKRDPAPSLPAENESESAKQKKGPDALGTTGNDSVSAKHESGTRRPRYRGKGL
jgi:hypothetical protein